MSDGATYFFGCFRVESTELAEQIHQESLRIIERAMRDLDPKTIECMNVLSGTFSV